jgi:2-hydroxychromene-2-carboxylate isomerase
MKTVDFYFDFVSPYAYLASSQLSRLVERYGINLVLHPIDLFRAKKAAGNTGPSTREIPSKAKYALMDLQRWAKRYGLPLTRPPGFDTGRANRGFLWARSRGAENPYFHAAYAAVWGHGGDPGDPQLLRSVAMEARLPVDDFLLGVDAEPTLNAYEQENLEAQARGIFGTPTFIVDDEMYWGNDRIDFLEEYLQVRTSIRR